ncbi:mitogen-activated protein kinase [Elasticomyces elasticus]|uniref:cyclin-dependent kinase n=1 Tax=Elasticomyces elasticus TaxID=574655 RepID=A0AAN7WG30_9PEZI|nr:mitogen-activated protein kinase [Elasticomyces elasticus]
MATDWQQNLSFSERLAAISSMHVYRPAHPECSDFEATKSAKALEVVCRKNATSLSAYHDSIAAKIQALLSSAPSGTSIGDGVTAELSSVDVPPTGTQIRRYNNAQHHGNGLFSEVFKATALDENLKDVELVALKVTTPDMMKAPHDSKRESRILTAARSSHVVPLIDAFQQAGGRWVLVFPFMPCGLDGLLRTGKPTDTLRRSILRDVLTGLAHVHSLGIIHRDIKPSNILLASPNGPAYLADFGIAWSQDDPASEASDQKILDVGTTCYRPPELLFGHQAYGTKLDMWATGCVAAQVLCLNGRTLFDAGDLGSELALIKSIFETLGTPNLDVWPEAAGFPDWGKMNFTQYPANRWQDILRGAEPLEVELVSRLVVYESDQRLDADEALKHECLQLRSS